ncbi:histone-lysine N-methyltransferase, H3 lysine-9 specific SUVH1-like [Malania oleifera]|uniref:histone-lysine N-methyltransferase, H3 lysine-9 specific SUVH1-like n=1 Tax=Malania oleifera TaxID=397392 RepID=UPI0025AE8516|nr:histone-lysine N-methyltransferase, H3 lysine-9 specific SUVH1-like [Malania oleifera]
MEGGSGPSYVPPATAFDKSRILDVRPLRSLVPVFPSSTQAPPFICAPPCGPFPPGFSPFYPFSMPQGPQPSPEPQQQTPPMRTTNQEGGFPHTNPMQTPPGPMPTPIRSFRAPDTVAPPHRRWASNGDAGSSMEASREMGMPSPNQGVNLEKSTGQTMNEDGFFDSQKRAAPHLRGSYALHKKTKRGQDVAFSADGDKGSGNNYLCAINSLQRDEGDSELVGYILMTFDALRRRLCQLDDAKEAPSGGIRRMDLKAGNILMSKGVRTNMRKRIGDVPGVEIGDIFFFRMELCLVGLHAQSMAGIDYMVIKGDLEEDPFAVSIVSSGGYDDEAEDRDVLIYSGQGGNFNRKDRQAADQKLERGNLALERSLRRENDVRVIRGMKDAVSPSARVYVYDGLYTIHDSWMEKGKSGCNIFKYKLVRKPGQPGAFAIWKTIQKWKEGFASRAGLILPDLTSGAESIPVSLVNDVDDERGPAYFTYFPTLKYSKSFSLTQPSYGCNCHNACLPGDLNCSCIRKNGGDYPYTSNGILVSRKPMVYECGPTCPCFPNCKNRVSQTGLKVRLEVFKTKDRGWGLRSWDPIRAGTFICEYAGEVIDKAKVKLERDEGENDEYIFDTTRVYENIFKWNYEPGLLDEESSGASNENYKIPFPLIISAKNVGNVARFMNHSCSANVFWQPLIYEHNNESFLHIAFFAIKHIPPMRELTYDYGIPQSEKCDLEGNIIPRRRKKCLCGSAKCRGYYS